MKYDPATLLGFTTSLLAIISCVFTLITLSRDWRRRTDFARDILSIHRREIDVLKRVVGECREIISSFPQRSEHPQTPPCERGSPVEEGGGGQGEEECGGNGEGGRYGRELEGVGNGYAVPQSVVEALRMCEQREADLMRVMALPPTGVGMTLPVSHGAYMDVPNTLRGFWSWWAVNLRLPLVEKELKRKYEMFKEDVLLLRALCSE